MAAMFGIGMPEMLLIAVILAVIVYRYVGRWVGRGDDR